MDVDCGFGREHMRVAIQVRAEQHAFFRDLAQIAEAEDLEAARIGEDRARPRHEAVQSAEFPDYFVARAEEQVIGVRQDDFGVQLAGQIALHDAFDGGLGADGHEDRGFDDAVGGVDASSARASVGALGVRVRNALFHCKRLSPTSEDCSHYASVAMTVHHCDHPQRLFIWRVSN